MTASAWTPLARFLLHLTKYYTVPVAVTIWLFVRSVPARIRGLRGSNWAMAQGRIETIDVDSINVQREFATATLGYSYRIAEQLHSGYYSREFGDEQQAWDYADDLRNKEVVVRYQPNRPEVSVLRPQDQAAECKLRPESEGFVMHFYRLLKSV